FHKAFTLSRLLFLSPLWGFSGDSLIFPYYLFFDLIHALITNPHPLPLKHHSLSAMLSSAERAHTFPLKHLTHPELIKNFLYKIKALPADRKLSPLND